MFSRNPQRIPQVSRFRVVLGEAIERNVLLSWLGRKTVRNGVPSSREEGVEKGTAGVSGAEDKVVFGGKAGEWEWE